MTTEENAVYTALLNERHRDAGVEFVFLRGETVNGLLPFPAFDSMQTEQIRFVQANLRSVDSSTLSDFVATNREPRLLDRLDGFTTPHDVLTGSILSQLEENPRQGIASLRNRQSGPFGIVSLSRVGFSAGGTQALVYAQFWCGGDCGHGEYVLLEKRDAGWQVQEDAVLFVS